MEILNNHFSILQILLPFFCAICTAFMININSLYLKAFAIIATLITTAISAFGIYFIQNHHIHYYALGNWPAPIGIEYRTDILSQVFIFYINIVILFFLLFNHKILKANILQYIHTKYCNIFYAILLFAHAGYIGILSTNDLFNMYVFIEISSLATYVLMAQGDHQRAQVGAFDYLMLGTIGATMILIAIGFLISFTGSLNITDIQSLVAQQGNSKVLLGSIAFFLTGSMLKIACFPMHFWMIRSYISTPSIMLTYIAPISGVIGSYIMIRFLYYTIDYQHFQPIITKLFTIIAFATIIACTIMTLLTNNLKKIVVYSSAIQIGYIILLVPYIYNLNIVIALLIIDGINKLALFTIIAYTENIPEIKHKHRLSGILIALIVISSAGLPLSAAFLIKIKILENLIQNSMFTAFIIAMLGFTAALLYYYKFTKYIFCNYRHLYTDTWALACIISIQFAMLFVINSNIFSQISI